MSLKKSKSTIIINIPKPWLKLINKVKNQKNLNKKRKKSKNIKKNLKKRRKKVNH